MTEILVLEAGTEKEVMTDDEVQELKTKAEGSETISQQCETLKTELDIKEGDNLEDKIKELKESSNPNWKEARGKIKTLETVVENLKKDGKQIADDGTITEVAPTLTNEEITKTATDATNQTLYNNERTRLLSRYTDEKQKEVVEHYLDKLMNGETQSTANLNKFITEADRLSVPAGQAPKDSRPLSSYPNDGINDNKDDWSETPEGKASANAMGLSHAKEQPKK